MLVLTRRPNESIIIANNIRITVVSVGPGRVKLGIEAPPHIRVDRKEIHEKIEQATDVLAAVGVEPPASETLNTVVSRGPDTELIVSEEATPNAVASEESTSTAAPPLPLNKINKFRPPRKPR